MKSHFQADWELWREDDNGNRFLVGRFSAREGAEERLRELTRSVHKQFFWIRQRNPAEASPGPGDRAPGRGQDPA